MARRNNSPVDNFAPERLRHHRANRRLTAEELGALADVARPNIVAFEAGRRSPSFATVVALADALRVAPLELTTSDGTTLTVADLRLAARLTRHDLAAAINVTYPTWYAIETGRRRLTDDIARRAARALGVDVDIVRTAHQTTRHHAQLRGHPTTTARHFALTPGFDPHADQPATATWTRRRIAHMIAVAGLDGDTITVTTDPDELAELTGIVVGAATHGIASRHPSGPVLYIDPHKAGSRAATERLIAHEIGHLKWPSLNHRARFFERVQQLLDAA